MRRFARLTTLLALAVLGIGASSAPAAEPVGTLTVCNGVGNPPVAIPLTFSLVAPASDGGTQLVTLAKGACSGRYFFPVGLVVTVIENVPTGDAITSITISGESKLSQTSPAGGLAGVTMGNADSTVTFTTRGPGTPTARPCIVPRVIGLTLAAARTAIKHAACKVKSVTYIHSTRIPKGGVTSSKPKRGTHLAHNAGVRLYVSKG